MSATNVETEDGARLTVGTGPDGCYLTLDDGLVRGVRLAPATCFRVARALIVGAARQVLGR